MKWGNRQGISYYVQQTSQNNTIHEEWLLTINQGIVNAERATCTCEEPF